MWKVCVLGSKIMAHTHSFDDSQDLVYVYKVSVCVCAPHTLVSSPLTSVKAAAASLHCYVRSQETLTRSKVT